MAMMAPASFPVWEKDQCPGAQPGVHGQGHVLNPQIRILVQGF
jgi:hypothetical protein